MHVLTKSSYLEYIKSYITYDVNEEKPSLEKIRTLAEGFWKTTTIEGDKDFAKKLESIIDRIVQTKPGVELISRFLKINQPLFIRESHETNTTELNHNRLTINLGDEHFCLTVNQNEEKYFIPNPIEAVFLHELIHFVHVYNLNSTFHELQANSLDLIDPDMDDEEEQLTISGFSKVDKSEDYPLKSEIHNKFNNTFFVALTDPCCENSFHIAFGHSIRINHHGSTLGSPTLIDMIKEGAIGSLKQLNLKTYNITIVQEHRNVKLNISLLSAAAFHRKIEVIDFLILSGADINIEDEIGGALQAAIKRDFIPLAFKLLAYKIDTKLKDIHGKTALDNLGEASKFCKRRKPLVKELERLSTSL